MKVYPHWVTAEVSEAAQCCLVQVNTKLQKWGTFSTGWINERHPCEVG